MKSLLFSLTLSFSFAAAEPAKIITNLGPEYAETARVWQGIPGIERTAKGRLWATWYSGDVGEGAIGNYAMVATSGGDDQKWSKPVAAIQGQPGTAIGDPLPWIDPKGRLWVFYHQSGKEMGGTYAIRADNPESAEPQWSAPRLIAAGGILFGKPISRSSGGWLAPFFAHGNSPWKERIAGKETGVILSTDEGESWNWLGGTSVPEKLRNFSEATIAERKDKSLWMVMRTHEGLYESSSQDQGKTWSTAVSMPTFPGGSTRACMRRLQSGSFVLIYHDVQRLPAGGYPRARLTAWLSKDEGRTWPHKLLVDERNRLSYPDATQAPDGKIYIAYDHGRYEPGEKEVLLGIVREEDIVEGKMISPNAKTRIVINKVFGYGNHSDLRTEAKTAETLPQKERLHLYLLIGQSNMAGRGVLDTEERLSRLRVLKFSPRNAWTVGVEPLHQDKPAAVGAGIGMSFAREMAEADPAATIGLVPCAVGGTPLERWVKGGDLYAQALGRARLAMKDGTLKGILWHQGEGDSADETKATTYGVRLAKMVADLRADLGAGEVPFVAGKLGEFLKKEGKDGKPSYWPVVNEQLAALPNQISNTAVADSTGLKHKGDDVHF
ncbi:MAG: sialate O-acetylesterase, partial [Prosthecobacter sp.]|nr:sialate O-acetylesterase [Prosthecobacter sp.]